MSDLYEENINNKTRRGEMAQWINSLLHRKHEDAFGRAEPAQTSDTAVHACLLSTGDWGQQGLVTQSVQSK